MDPAALAAACAILAPGGSRAPAASSACPRPAATAAAPTAKAGEGDLAGRIASPSARDAIARVAFAEAGDQGDSGLAAVVYTILNRLQDRRWGDTIDAVLNARGQFEPVMHAGGDWRALRPVSAAAQARIDTILNLALDGRLPDLTNGARFFQNPTIVARRAQAGEVSAQLVDFGGASPSASIGAHRFYVGPGRAAPGGGRGGGVVQHLAEPGIFVGANRAEGTSAGGAEVTDPPTSGGPAATGAGDPAQALFVSPSGAITGPQP